MDHRILSALQYMEQDVSDQIDLTTIAARAGLGKFYFARLFQKEVGESFYAYSKRVRMHNAAARLKWTDQPIVDIAIAYGYSSNAAFTRAFSAFWGVSPTAYRTDDAGWDAGKFYEKHTHDGLSIDNPIAVEVRAVEPYRCVYKRYYGSYWAIQTNWRDFFEYLSGLLQDRPREGARFIGRVYDDPRITPPHETRYDCCYVLAGEEASRLQATGVEGGIIATDPRQYAVVDNNDEPRSRADVYTYVLERWMPQTNYNYSDVPALEFFDENPVAADVWAPACTMLVPLE